MGFLGELRRAEADRQEQARRFNDGLRERAAEREREEAEMKRMWAARADALNSSVVPELAREAGRLIQGGKVLHTEHMGMMMISFGSDHDTYIDIEGREDGSVRIGKTTLSPRDSRDPSKVEKALGKAYHSPEQFHRSTDTPEGCGS